MRWRRTLTLSALLAAAVPAVAQAETELSVGDRLKDRREVAAGTRAYSVGFQDGRFYANGWHITGEMGGIWAPPLKLADGVWFGVDDAVGRAGDAVHERPRATPAMTLPRRGGLQLRRTDFVPDGRRAALFGLELTQPAARPTDRDGQGRRALRADDRLPVDLRRGPTRPRRQPAPTPARFDATARWRSGTWQAHRCVRRPHDTGRSRHHRDRAWVPRRAAHTGVGVRGRRRSTLPSSGCDDGPIGRGAGGRLRYARPESYRPSRPRCGSRWPAQTRTCRHSTARATKAPDGAARAPSSRARESAGRTAARMNLPGDRQPAEGRSTTASRTSPTSRRRAKGLQIRFRQPRRGVPAPRSAC